MTEEFIANAIAFAIGLVIAWALVQFMGVSFDRALILVTLWVVLLVKAKRS